jgi:GNAT superfamily N-acetyltransferase
MADIDRLAIARLGVRDAPAALLLSTEARWNQNEADWRFFLGKGLVFGVRDETRLGATAALLPYSEGNAWISMVLVTQSWRRRSLATRLMQACVNAASERGITPWLDATPAGATVYRPLGFAPTLQLRRLRLETTMPIAPRKALVPGDLAAFVARDASTIGFARGDLLRELAGRPGSRLVSKDGASALIRDGRTARHIGPLFADSADGALALVHDIAASGSGTLLIDAVAEQDEFLKGLTSSGWTIERPFQRMRFGRATAPGTELPFAVAGPEYG